MGGSSGSGKKSLEHIKKLEKKAKDELDRASRKTIFLSFNYDDIDDVNLFRAHSKNENSDIDFIDRSVKEPFNSDRAEYIRQKISERIQQCSTTVVYLSENSKSSSWVDWEVKKSLQLNKDVIAVHKGNTPPRNIPNSIKENHISIVPWKNLSDYL